MPTQPVPAAVTRIARRKATPGHEREYEDLVREMFALMARHGGFCGGELVPPEHPGEDYQVIIHFASEAELAEWDASEDRHEIFARMREHAGADPERRRLDGLEAWFVPAGTPLAAARPARWRMVVMSWLGIWPMASLFIAYLAPFWTRLGFPYLLVTAVNVLLICLCMTYAVAPALTRLLRGFLQPRR